MLILRCAGLAALLFAVNAHAANAAIDNVALANEADGRNWASYGRTFSETHYSPLTEINRETVPRLSLAWTVDLDVAFNQSTPLAVDGVIYVAAGYSRVHAVDAKSGKLLWRYDPEVLKVAGAKLRGGWGIRGLAYWKGRIFIGTHDGRLIAIDAKSGAPVWTVQTLGPNDSSFISGAPRVFNDKVVIGFEGGAARGFVTAYDTNTGKQLWRWHTVPGDPAKAFENPAMEMAARTWSGQWWKPGGRGAVWNAMTYDPEFNRLYIGTGSGSAEDWKAGSAGGGDQLFLSSVVALNADTGEYAWHYQTTPGDSRNYDAAMDLTLATLDIGGVARKVIMHAPENGFFYVLDRATGKPLSAGKLGTINWAAQVDLATGRPVLTPAANPAANPLELWPGAEGAHNVYPQSFSSKTHLVYVPTIELPEHRGAPSDGEVGIAADNGKSFLTAWDPVRQRPVWQQPTPGAHSGGTLATAGDLVFQGQADGYINAYGAADGRRVWSFYAATAALGTPISFAVGKQQYVSILTGPLSGAAGSLGQVSAKFGWDSRVHPRRLLTFVLDGKAKLPPTPPPTFAKAIDAAELAVDEALAKEGAVLWSRCQSCHGAGAIAGGTAPDLRASLMALNPGSFATVVNGGLETRGMPGFAELGARELDALRSYIRQRARVETRPQGVAPAPEVTKSVEETKPAEDREPDKPPGSLESTGTPPKT